MKISCAIDIHAPIDVVFDVFSDIGRAAERIDGIKKIEVLDGPSKMAVGTKWKETRIMFGKEAVETMWVTELNSPKSFIVEAESHGTKYHSEYIFTEIAHGTHVAMTFEGIPQTISAKVMNILFGFMTKSMKGMLLHDMSDLKRICEDHPKSSSKGSGVNE